MRIFLDTRDLINLLEGRGPCSVDYFRQWLRNGGHKLVLNLTVIFEISAPLSDPSSKTVVTRLLNDLERLPHVFINDAQIQPKEVESAIHLYSEGREYVPIVPPYVDRLDKAIPISGPPHTDIYINFGLAETVYTIWWVDRNAFRWPEEQVKRLLSGIALDRSMPNAPTVAQHFREKLRRDLKLYNIPHPQSGVDDLADWIYETPTRCPAVRIGYEVYHQIRRNVGDQPAASDFGDFAHVQCLPYVDLMTLDRRMADYVRRATQGWKDDPAGKVMHGLDSIMREL